MSEPRRKKPATTFYTIGYGGRAPDDFLDLLLEHGVHAVADVRLRPDRSTMGSYTRARTPDKGIERLLADRGISYHPILELGNFLMDVEDWDESYRALFDQSGELLVARLLHLPTPFCLLCAEKRVADCHRQVIADYLVRTRGWAVTHIE